jgi:hypothetical protein
LSILPLVVICCSQTMNVFDTEHRINARTVDKRCGKWSSFFGAMCVVSLVFFPFVAGITWYLNLTDINTTDYVPDPFWLVAIGAAIESFLLSSLIVSLLRFGCWLLSRFTTPNFVRTGIDR